jgi:ketosteroid isomerase-like protein
MYDGLAPMTNLLAFSSIVLAILLSQTAVANQGGRAEQDRAALTQIQQDLAKAWVSGDQATIERIIAPEWRSTGPDGRSSDRAVVFADVFKKRVHKIRRLEIDDVRVQVFGDAAVVTGRTRGTGEFAGTPYDVVIRFTDTFIRRASQWLAVASHSSLEASR